MKNENETITVTIKKSDLGFLKAYAVGMDGAIQSLCGASLANELKTCIDSPTAPKERKIVLGKISLASTEVKSEFQRIIQSIEKAAQ